MSYCANYKKSLFAVVDTGTCVQNSISISTSLFQSDRLNPYNQPVSYKINEKLRSWHKEWEHLILVFQPTWILKIDSFHWPPTMSTLTSFMIHDSLGFSKIHVDSIQFNSFMASFHKGLNSWFTKAGSSAELVQLTIQLTYDSLHQIQLNAIQQKTRFISDTC